MRRVEVPRGNTIPWALSFFDLDYASGATAPRPPLKGLRPVPPMEGLPPLNPVSFAKT